MSYYQGRTSLQKLERVLIEVGDVLVIFEDDQLTPATLSVQRFGEAS
jgi:hypothetical protein